MLENILFTGKLGGGPYLRVQHGRTWWCPMYALHVSRLGPCGKVVFINVFDVDIQTQAFLSPKEMM